MHPPLCVPGPCLRVYARTHHWASKILGVKADNVVAMATQCLFCCTLIGCEDKKNGEEKMGGLLHFL